MLVGTTMDAMGAERSRKTRAVAEKSTTAPAADAETAGYNCTAAG